MCQYLSREDEETILNSSIYYFPYNKELKMSCWESYNAKNWEYYNGNRFFKISRKNYRDYQRGLVYGYYYNGNGYMSEDDVDELEHAF